MSKTIASGVVAGFSVVAASLLAGPALAATRVTSVVGSMSPTQETCLQGLTTSVGDGEDCMYAGAPGAPGSPTPFGEVTGPYNQITYYDSAATPAAFQTTINGLARQLYVPTVGDGKMSQDISGTVTINDNGNGFGADDLVSFTLTLTSSGAGSIIRHYGSSVADQYDSMTQVLAPTTVTSATPNGLGGFTYLIGSDGFPDPLTYTQSGACFGLTFGFVECGHSFGTPAVDPDFWDGTSAAGLGLLEGNAGAKTTGTVTNLQCIDSRSATGVESNDCRDSQVSYYPWVVGPNQNGGGGSGNEGTVGSVRGAAEDVGWDNLLLKIVTNSAGGVVSVEAFNVDDYRVFGVTRCGDNTTGTGTYSAVCNSWTSGYFTLDRVAPVANDDGLFDANEGEPLEIDVLANDTGFADDVTVAVTTPPGKGDAVVTGSPGPQAGVRIVYTAGAGQVGADSFVYTVTDADGDTTETATVTLAIGQGAKPDTATTTRNVPVVIDVAANDTGFDNTFTITVNNGSFSAGGSAVVLGDNTVRYTPAFPANTATQFTETFSYTIDDGVLAPDTATVTVTVNNLLPAAVDGNITVTTKGVIPSDAPTGSFVVQDVNLGDEPSVVAIVDDGTHGVAEVADDGVTIVYQVTDDDFFTGEDTVTYTITDADGDSSEGTLTVLATDETPAITASFIVVGQGRVSVPLKPSVTLGNGAAEDHALAVIGQGTHGSCSVSPADGSGKITYTPADDEFNGTDSCEVRLTDADGDSVDGSVSIKIEQKNQVGGAGSLDPWLLMLLGLPLLRRLAGRRGTGVLAVMAATGLALALLPAPPAVAQIEEIVVTARKVEENLQEVPLAITAFSAAAIEEKGISNLADVATLTPGLSLFNAFGENLPVPVIRGVAPTDIFGENNAAVFVDGVFISGREGLNSRLLDVERIEVVKGPQSALYGRNAFSGAVNYVTKAPSDAFEATVDGDAGNRDRVKISSTISGPLFTDRLLGRIGALYEDFDGTYDNPISDNDLGGHRYRLFQGKLRWLPTDAVTVDLAYYHANDDIDESATVSLPTNCEDRVNDNNSSVRLQNFCGEVPDMDLVPGMGAGSQIQKVDQATGENRELDRAHLRIDWDLGDIGLLSSLTGYSKTTQNSVSDFQRSLGDDSKFLYCEGASEVPPGNPNSCLGNPFQAFYTGIFDRELGGETEDWSQELRYTSPRDNPLKFTAGAYYFHTEESAYPGGTIATRPLPEGTIGLPPIQGSLVVGSAIFYDTFTPDGGLDPFGRKIAEETKEGWAIFAGIDYDVTDRLVARAELRYSDEDQETNLLRYQKCFTTDGGGCVFPDPDPSAPDAIDTGKTGDDRYDLRYSAPLPFFDVGCQVLTNVGSLINGTTGQCSGRGENSFDSVTGRIGLDFNITDEWMVYGSVAYGEKPGGFQLVGGRDVLPGGGGVEPVLINSSFDGEELTAYEVGLKGTTWEGRMTIAAAVFFNDWKKIVLRQLVETNPETGNTLEQPVALNVNAGDSGSLGFEIETNVAFTDSLRGRVTFGWVDGELDNGQQDTFETFPTFAPDGDLSGNNLLRQPEILFSTSLDYEHALFDGWEWYIGGDANYQSEVYVGNENQGWLPEHTYVNTRLGFRNERYKVEFWTRNLFNDDNATAAFRDIYWTNTDDQYGPHDPATGAEGDFDDFVPLRYTVSYPTARTYGLSVVMRFGAAAE